MLITLSGAQGSGKTTVLNNLKNLGFNIVERKTARSILSEWNTTLDAVYRDPALTQQFQEEVLIRKSTDEDEAVQSDQLWFTERSYSDLFTYTVLTIGRYNEYNQWVNDYFDRCRILQRKYIAVFYFMSGVFETENDGIRGINKHYVKLVDSTLHEITTKISSTQSVSLYPEPPIFQIGRNIIDVNDRTRQIADKSQQIWLTKRLPFKSPILVGEDAQLLEAI